MEHPLFNMVQGDGVITVCCRFCRRIMMAGGFPADASFNVTVCDCAGAQMAVGEMLKKQPAKFNVSQPE